MKKKILLIGYNYSPEPTGIGKYSGEMIAWLAKQGYDCTVITCYPYYPYWRVQEPYFKKRFSYQTERINDASGGSITIHRCPAYIPANPSGLKRIALDLTFLLTSSVKLTQLLFSKGANSIMVVAPSFQFGLLGVLYKKIKKSQFIYHIHDMQIEAARDLNLIKSKPLLNLMFGVEKYIFNKANIISTVSEQMVRKIHDKSKRYITLFPNWVDTSVFYPIENKAYLKNEFGFAVTDKILLYSGGIGEKQGLESIIYAAKELCNHTEIKILICGSGPYKEKLLSLVAELKLNNVIFFPLQPIEKFNEFLNMADLHLVIQKAGASDLMMPSKLTTILAVGGLALVTANAGSGLHALIEQHNIGIVVEAENQLALNTGIQRAITGNNENIRANARKYAENNLFIDKIMMNFESQLA